MFKPAKLYLIKILRNCISTGTESLKPQSVLLGRGEEHVTAELIKTGMLNIPGNAFEGEGLQIHFRFFSIVK